MSRIDAMFLNFGKDIAIFVVVFIVGIIILMTKKEEKDISFLIVLSFQ